MIDSKKIFEEIQDHRILTIDIIYNLLKTLHDLNIIDDHQFIFMCGLKLYDTKMINRYCYYSSNPDHNK